MGVFFDQQKRGLVVLGGKKVKKEGRVIAGGQRSRLNSQIFYSPFCQLVAEDMISTCDKNGGLKIRGLISDL